MRHAHRSKNLFADGAFPTETAELSLEVAHGHDREIVVLIGAAKALVGLEIAQAADQVFAAEVGGIPNEVVARKTRAMREKVTRCGLFARDRIVHLKFGKVRADGLVPIDLAFVFENAEGESRERFGDRADGKQGGGRDREFVFKIATTVT